MKSKMLVTQLPQEPTAKDTLKFKQKHILTRSLSLSLMKVRTSALIPSASPLKSKMAKKKKKNNKKKIF
jgi:hypothetical protein